LSGFNSVEEGLVRDLENPFMSMTERCILGSDTFVDQIKRLYLLSRDLNKREELELGRLQRSFSFKAVLDLVSGFYGTTGTSLLQRRSLHREARKALMYCVCQYCSAHTTLTELASLRGISISGLTMGRHHVITTMAHDKKLHKSVLQIEKILKESV